MLRHLSSTIKVQTVTRSVSSLSAPFRVPGERQVRRTALQRLMPQVEGGFGPSSTLTEQLFG